MDWDWIEKAKIFLESAKSGTAITAISSKKDTYVSYDSAHFRENAKNNHENEIPAHIWVALDAGGIQPDELPDWSPGSCQPLLLDVKELYPDRFTFRGGLGYHGVNCPEEWPPEFSMAIQSVYIQAMQCSEKDWRVFLDKFDSKKET